MKHYIETIIDKALHKITAHEEANKDTLDIAVDIEDEEVVKQSYTVSFRRESEWGEWTPVTIRESGMQG